MFYCYGLDALSRLSPVDRLNHHAILIFASFNVGERCLSSLE